MDSISLKQKRCVLPHEIKENNITASNIIKKNEKKFSQLTYNKNSLFIQTPIFNGYIDVKKFELYNEYLFKVPNNNTGNDFIEMIKKIELQIINLSKINKDEWFDDKHIRLQFKSTIKNLDDDENSNIIKIRIPKNIKAKRLYVDSLDNLENPDVEELFMNNILNNNSNIRLIININAIWFSDNMSMLGLFLKPVYVEEIYLNEIIFNNDYNYDGLMETEFEFIPRYNDQNNKVCEIKHVNRVNEEMEYNENRKINNMDKIKEKDIKNEDIKNENEVNKDNENEDNENEDEDNEDEEDNEDNENEDEEDEEDEEDYEDDEDKEDDEIKIDKDVYNKLLSSLLENKNIKNKRSNGKK